MRGVFNRFRRVAALLALFTVLVAHVAVAAERDGDRGLRKPFARAKRFVVTVLARLGLPPG